LRKKRQVHWHEREATDVKTAAALTEAPAGDFVHACLQNAFKDGLPPTASSRPGQYNVPKEQQPAKRDLGLRLSDNDSAALKEAAQASWVTMTQYIRRAVLPVLQETLQHRQPPEWLLMPKRSENTT
jgi:hypothetical protein